MSIFLLQTLMIKSHISSQISMLKLYLKVRQEVILFITSLFLSLFLFTGTPVGNPVITLSAIDSDSTNLTYSIIEGDDFDFFRINSSTGVVYVKNTLDREKEENVEMMIKVTDGSFNVCKEVMSIWFPK